MKRTISSPVVWLVILAAVNCGGTQGVAATMEVAPLAPRPGDVLTVTVTPAAGETLTGVSMSAFDTKEVKFYGREDGSVRAFVGFPYDRKAGEYDLDAHALTASGDQMVHYLVKAHARVYPTQYVTMHDKKTAAKMDNKEALQAEKLHVQSKMKESNGSPLWQGPWIIPASGKPSSPYGRRRFVNGKWWGQHNGSDIKAGVGAPIHATNSGRVVLSEFLPALRGNCVVIDHGCNVFSVYMHLSRRIAQEGQVVQKGELIGLVGATGFVTGPHLHWEMRIGWEPVDPYQFVTRGLKF